MDQTGICGTATISYDSDCDWVCTCSKGKCTWFVQCPRVGGGTNTTSGTGLVRNGSSGDHRPKVTVRGSVEGCAAALEKSWKRKVTVPKDMHGQRFRKRTVTGTPEEVAKALGLTLAPKRRR
jgi:hypothetical protein